MAVQQVTATFPASKYEIQNAESQSNENNMLTDTSSSTYCSLSLKKGSNQETDVLLWFDFSSIPMDATIKSITVRTKAKIGTDSGFYISTKSVEYHYNNLTINTVNLKTSVTTLIVYEGNYNNSLTIDALMESYVQVRYKRGAFGTTTNRAFEIYGADVIVEYEYNPSPIITLGTPTRTKISKKEGYNQSICTFTCNKNLQYWEARAVYPEDEVTRGVGNLVESGTNLLAGETATIIIDAEEITKNIDAQYIITVFGQSDEGEWSE